MRKLKYHEKKLLKKVDFLSWEIDNNLHEVRVMKKYYVQKREDYTKWELRTIHSLIYCTITDITAATLDGAYVGDTWFIAVGGRIGATAGV